MKRSEIREKVMSAIYSFLIREEYKIEFEPLSLLSESFNEDINEIDTYAKEIYLNFIKHRNEIVTKVQSHMTNWTFDRINSVAKAIFFVSCSENYIDECDKKIIINEGVNLAKKYIPNDDYKYINAILDKVINE